MPPSLTPDQIRSLAPDAAAARAGETLSARRHWSGLGRDDRAVWGLCQGSGKDPYQVVVDLAGPAFRCSCPSRKFPCKHALGLMLLGAVDPAAIGPSAVAPAWAAGWLAGRTEREAASAARAEKVAHATAGDGSPEDVAAAASAEANRRRRVESRERKVDGGLADLDRWLDDLVRRGLLAAKGEGYAFWDRAGARLVDAQAASLGREVRAVGAATNRAAGWAESALERLGRIHLIVEAYRHQDALPAGLRADVRALVGWTVKEDELPSDGDVEDRWLAVGRTVTSDERLTTARTWLLGESTGRFALHLAFHAGDGNPIPIAIAGASTHTTLRFYPSATPLRAVAPDGAGAPGAPVETLPGARTIGEVAGDFAGVLARNPFVTTWPTVLGPVVPIGVAEGLRLRDATGAAVPVKPAAIAARLVALAGGRPVTVFGLWSGRTIRVLSAIADGRFVDLGADTGDEAELVAEPVPASADGRPPDPDAESGDRAATFLDPVAWSRLVSTALLGTERTAGIAVALPGPLAAVAGQPGERRLLAAAAVTATATRAGWQPGTVDEAGLEPAPDDVRPTVGAAAAWILRRILDETPELVAEWLERARGADRRPPDDELPRLLALAQHRPAVRSGLAPVLGPRAAWLVRQLPELAAGMPSADGAAAIPDPRADPAGFREMWDARSSAAGRAALVAELRARDRSAARAALGAIWDDATTEERSAALETLDAGLEPADEPILVRAWQDRRSEVRSAAGDRLARLPGSAYAVLVDAIVRPLVRQSGRMRPSLEADPPAWSDDLGRLGIIRKAPTGIGERAWWLRQLVGRVAPARWHDWLGLDAKTLVERAKRSDEATALTPGLVDAAERFRDATLAGAILADRELLGREEVQAAEPFQLVRHLPPRRADEAAIGVIGVADAAIAGAVARELPAPWSPLVSWAVTTALARTPAPASGWLPVPVRDLARLAARRVAAGSLPELERVLEAVGGPLGTPLLADAFDLIRLRRQLDAAFAAEGGGAR